MQSRTTVVDHPGDPRGRGRWRLRRSPARVRSQRRRDHATRDPPPAARARPTHRARANHRRPGQAQAPRADRPCAARRPVGTRDRAVLPHRAGRVLRERTGEPLRPHVRPRRRSTDHLPTPAAGRGAGARRVPEQPRCGAGRLASHSVRLTGRTRYPRSGTCMTVTEAALREASSRNDELIDADLIRQWLACGLAWLLFFPTIGVLISTKFNYPGFLGDTAWLTFGRMRPIHVNGVIWGAFSTLFIGLCHYVVPRLTGVRLWGERWSYGLLWVWNLNLAAAVVLLALGWNRGWEAGEFPLLNVVVTFLALLLLTAQFLMTIKQRRERPLYVSLWYLIAAFIWTDVNLVLLMLGPYHIPGINNAAWHGLFIHYVVGLWITPAGYVLIYYFLPASVKNPIYSHRLSLIGFWSLAFFYPFVGIHHYLYSPIADWAETLAIITSMLLIIPVWTVLVNFFGTVKGRWDGFGKNLPAKFLIMGSLMYLLGCFQGSTEALRSVQQPTHFTDFVIAHSHLTVFGTFVVWAIAGAVYVWPRLCRRELWSPTLGNWSFWLITLGISTMGLGLTAQGLQQGFMLMARAEWVDTLVTMKPFWLVRTFSGISMDTGMSLLVYNFMQTYLSGPGSRAVATPARVG